MTTAETDQQLVARVQKGDPRAFDLLVLKYQHKIFGLINRYVRDVDEVQDVAQEAFIKAYKALPNFRGDSAFYTWLYRIAINTAKNYLVSRSRRPPGKDVEVEDAEYYDRTTDPEESRDLWDERREEAQELRDLVARYREQARSPWGVVPEEVELDELRLNHLRALGYVIKQ